MRSQEAIQSPESAEAPNATQAVDLLLYTLVKRQGTAIWFEPVKSDGLEGSIRIVVEKKRQTLASVQVEDGLGEAMLARLSILAGLDLMSNRVQNGRIAIRTTGKSLELLFTLRPNCSGLSGELHLLNDLGHEVDSVVAEQQDGTHYPTLLETGTVVDRYRVEKLLGHGGMGVVYLVVHTQLRKRFAMKVLHKDRLSSDPYCARRFVREALAAARVRHPGIVDVSDFGSFADGRHYLVMELLQGQSLHEWMDENGAMQPKQAVQLMRETASALGAAHASGIIHRDVTPSNIFLESVNESWKIKIVDFGAALVPDPDQRDVPDGPPGMVIGTPHYMSPEQVRALPTNVTSDIYSLGCVFYELVSGKQPFDGETAPDVAVKHITTPPPPLTNSDTPVELWLIIKRMMEKSPADRYPTADLLLADLERVQHIVERKGWRKWLPV